MKQLLPLFLFLLPCFALAQYPSNGNQKITLGEQTSADGLIFRGVASDTTLTAKSDTAAYFVLDTVNINLYTYKASATGRKWRQLGADTAAIAYVNTYDTQTVNGAKTFTSAVTATRFNPTANTVTGTGMFAPTSTSLGFSTNGTKRMTIDASGNFGLGVVPSEYSGLFQVAQIGKGGVFMGRITLVDVIQLAANVYYESSNFRYISDGFSTKYEQATGIHAWQVASSGTTGDVITYSEAMTLNNNGDLKILNLVGTGSRAVLADANGVLSAPVSSINTKENVKILNYGLNELLQINPVSFDYINKDKWGEERNLGFIVEDMFPVIPEVTGIMDNGDMYLDMTKLIPILTKAIQEQQALIKALEQRIINLENK